MEAVQALLWVLLATCITGVGLLVAMAFAVARVWRAADTLPVRVPVGSDRNETATFDDLPQDSYSLDGGLALATDTFAGAQAQGIHAGRPAPVRKPCRVCDSVRQKITNIIGKRRLNR